MYTLENEICIYLKVENVEMKCNTQMILTDKSGRPLVSNLYVSTPLEFSIIKNTEKVTLANVVKTIKSHHQHTFADFTVLSLAKNSTFYLPC